MAEAKRVRRSLPCIGCGYDLRGLEEGGVCPECAAPIGESMRVVSLVNAPVGHLSSLCRSMLLIELGAWLAATTIMLTASMALICVAPIPLIASVVLSTVGWLQLVSRSRAWQDEARLERRKRWVFWLVVARAAAFVGWLPASVALGGLGMQSVLTIGPMGAMTIGLTVLFAAKQGVGLTVLRDLFRLSGGTKMARLCHVMAFAGPWFFGAGIVGFVLDDLIGLRGTANLVFLVLFFALAIGWAVLYAVVVDSLRLRLAWIRDRYLLSLDNKEGMVAQLHGVDAPEM